MTKERQQTAKLISFTITRKWLYEKKEIMRNIKIFTAKNLACIHFLKHLEEKASKYYNLDSSPINLGYSQTVHFVDSTLLPFS